jgi:chromosome segregation ATPase
VSDLNPKATLREVSIEATPVNEEEDLDLLFAEVALQDKAIAKITNIFLDKLDDVDDFAVEAFGDDWLANGSKSNDTENKLKTLEANELKDELDRQDLTEKLQKELDALRSQHEFECEYVDQLEQEIISITSDRDRQVQELKTQLENLQDQLQNPKLAQTANITNFDDRDLSDRLAMHVLQLEEEFKHRLAIALEIESQKIDSQHLQEIFQKDEVIHQLQNNNNALEISQQTLTEELENTHSLLQECTKTVQIVQSKLTEVTAHRDQLKEELIQHITNQAQLHQSLRGLENEYVSDLRQVQHSEQQIEELQEQVLRQASKAAEYEAAIQHWKEQSVRHQHHALQLSAALDRLLAEKPLKHLTEAFSQPKNEIHHEQEYLSRRSPEATSESIPESHSEKSSARSFRPNSKVDLPAFLVRNR